MYLVRIRWYSLAQGYRYVINLGHGRASPFPFRGVHKAERVQGQVPKGLGCAVVIWPDAKNVWIVDYGTKLFFGFRKKGVNTNPIIYELF